MSFFNFSNEAKEVILKNAKALENEKRLLYVLNNLGPQRFTELETYCYLSRSTISKYLKFLIQQNCIKKKIHTDNKPRYFITEVGVEKLLEEPFEEDNDLLYINKLTPKLSNIFEFYKQIGVENSITLQIIKIISKIGEPFFTVEQNRELYLVLFYMFYNSILGQGVFASKYWQIEDFSDNKEDKTKKNDNVKIIKEFSGYKLNLVQFCEVYNIKDFQIKYMIDKVLSNQLGFYKISRGKDIFFFHKEDLLGTILLRLIKDSIIEKIIYNNFIEIQKNYDLDETAKEIAEQLKDMGLIWDSIQIQFEILLKKAIITTAIDMGISKRILTEFIVQSETLKKAKEEKQALIKILNGTATYEDLYVVSIPENENSEIDEHEQMRRIDEILIKIQGIGFCPNCGKLILNHEISKPCRKCEKKSNPSDLLKSIDAANEASIKFKQKDLLLKEKIECPNPECEAIIFSDWDECPICHTKIKRKT